jgi:hypothetical protein
MEQYSIPPSGLFMLQVELTTAGYFNQKIVIQDLSGITFGVRLTTRKQVLVNSVTTLLDYNTKDNSDIINCQNNNITVVIPINSLLDSRYYICSIYASNDGGQQILYKFQLEIDNISSSLPLIKYKKIILDELSYQFLAFNQQISQDSKC